MERKSFPAMVTKADEALGQIDTIFAVFGNVDDTDDIVHPGAFVKTFAERGRKVRILDQHRTDSIMAVLGKPLELREVGQEELPAKLRAEHPEASGGAFAKVQFLMDTPEGKGAFIRLRDDAISEWSFGYDAIGSDYSKVTHDGQEKTVRNLRELKLYEISPVLWGANPATQTTAAKSAPSEAKPYDVFHVGDEYCVHKVDEAGHMMGESLGCHATEDEARQQVEALYAEEPEAGGKEKVAKTEADGQHPAAHYLVVEDAQKPSTWHLRVRNVAGELDHRLMGGAWAALHGGYRGNVYEGPGKQEAIAKLRRLYEQEGMEPPGKSGETGEEEKAGRVLAARNATRIREAMRLLHQAMADAGLMESEEEEEDQQSGKAGPQPETPTPDGAGPSVEEAPTLNMLRLIEIEQDEIRLLEV